MNKVLVQKYLKDDSVRMLCSAFSFIVLLCLSSCGGGGGSQAVVTSPQYGSVEGYVYAPVGSGARAAQAVPAGEKTVQGANVFISCGSIDRNTTTNSTGYFKITSLSAGSCSLSVSYNGFNTYQTNTTVKANSTTTVGGSSGISLSPTLSGSITVTANVSGGEVLIDGECTGVSIPIGLSYTFDGIAPGEHAVSMSQGTLEGGDAQNITVVTNEIASVGFTMNPAGNRAPVADAGDDFKGFAGTKYIYEGWNGVEYVFTPTPMTFSLDGSGSMDPDGDTVTYQWQQIVGPAVSLDNPTTATTAVIPTQEGTYEFVLIVSDGYLKNASNNVVVNVSSPTGKLVFSCAYRSTVTSEICSMNANGSNLLYLTDNNKNNAYPQWSPDGTIIAYSENDSLMALIDSDGSRHITTSIPYGALDWFLDGTILAWKEFSGQMDFYQVKPDATGEQRLTTIGLNSTTAQISQDGSKIAFSQKYNGDNYEIMVMNSDGSNIQRLTNNTTTDLGVSWLPDESIIYKISNSFTDTTRSIQRMNSDGSNVLEIPIPNEITNISGPLRASDDGRFIFFKDQDGYLHVMYSDGSGSISYGITGGHPDYHPGP